MVLPENMLFDVPAFTNDSGKVNGVYLIPYDQDYITFKNGNGAFSGLSLDSGLTFNDEYRIGYHRVILQ